MHWPLREDLQESLVLREQVISIYMNAFVTYTGAGIVKTLLVLSMCRSIIESVQIQDIGAFSNFKLSPESDFLASLFEFEQDL